MKLTFSTHRGGAGPERQASRPPPQPVLSSTTFTRAQILFLDRQHFQQMTGEGQENSSFVSISISSTWHCHSFSLGRFSDLCICATWRRVSTLLRWEDFPKSADPTCPPAPVSLLLPSVFRLRSVRKSAGAAAVLLF